MPNCQKTELLFFFKSAQDKANLQHILSQVPYTIGMILNKPYLTKTDIETELKKANLAIEKIQEYKEKLYASLFFNI